ncbi:hypothetical protein BDN72DRAFT_243194 [Pluteus cervinus]|uniref:Uncharacterized protein n=1 Tax=Pluteus cervinus TaxID=181527 RepID=A0ACD3BFN6_9AGAR|nr:hypothetical protein BDN72DRAFT_243194 [Pluteus cervinus]
MNHPHHPESTSPRTSLNSSHIAEALSKSSDDGVSLVLSHLNLSDVEVSAAEQLAFIGREAPEDESIVERIALDHNKLTTLPMECALLSRLRYLNLKHNSFSVFPDVLTLLPALDILDLSYNKLKRLPSQPGKLIGLRVFNLYKNKLTRLPLYLTQFQSLDFLQLQRNPIEWPPNDVVSQPKDPGPQMKQWIRNLQQWMEEESPSTRGANDSGYSEQLELERQIDESYRSWKFPRSDQHDANAHSRTVSVDSALSASSKADSYRAMVTPTPLGREEDRPPALHLGMLSYGQDSSPPSYLPSPADSDTFDDSTIGYDSPVHERDGSAGGDLRPSPRREMFGNHSMPDLRSPYPNHDKYDDLGGFPPTITKATDEFSIPSPLSQRHDSSFGSLSRIMARNDIESRNILSMASERNQYFRRISTLPPSVLPKPLLCLVDSARTILFAVCQVYQILEHYVLHPIDDRLSYIFKKVLDPVNAQMADLISALDRFDSMSRRAQPSPSVCRAVVEACRDTVTAFSKALSVLSLQLRVITGSDDVRFTRRILLELYAATAEISCAWQTLVPHLEVIKSLIHGKQYTNGISNNNGHAFMNAEHSAAPTDSSALPIPRPTTGLGVLSTRSRIARRHAGSFSSKDVELGKKLPSYDILPGFTGGVASINRPIPFLRPPKRQATAPASVTVMSPSPTNPVFSPNSVPRAESSQSNHSREGSQASLKTSSTSSSPSIPPKSTFLELPTTSKTQIDRDALQAVMQAVEVAPIIWDMMEELLGDLDIHKSLQNARIVTDRLKETIQTLREQGSQADRKLLREDAHTFLKIVVQLSNITKKHGTSHAVSSKLRSNMVKLTNSTEEFAMLLHVSSFSPSNSRPYSPMLSPAYPHSNIQDEPRLNSSLSRTRSTQPLPSPKPPNSATQEIFHNGLNPNFQMPRRVWEAGLSVGSADPG